MSIFDKFKNKKDQPVAPAKEPAPAADAEKKESVKAEKKIDKAENKESKKTAKPRALKGNTDMAHRILIKALITEKASDIGVLNKYIFAVNPKANKVEIKKAIRTVYHVDPVKINISNFSGKSVRYGRVRGVTKGWKKAVVTLKPGDKIEVYEGV